MVKGSKWNHQLAIWLLRLSLELSIFSLRQGPEMWCTWFFVTQSCIVYVANFLAKICLLFKTLADWKTSGRATLGKTNGPFCETSGDRLGAEAVGRHSTTLLSFLKSRTSPVVQELAFPPEVLERVADKTCQGC